MSRCMRQSYCGETETADSSSRYLGGRDLSELVELSGFTEYSAERFKPRDTSVMEYIWGPPPEDENV